MADNVVTLHASAARTATGTGTTKGVPSAGRALRAQLNVTAENDAATGETLDVTIQDSLDGTNWNTIGTFTQATGVTREVINVQTPFANRLRAAYTIGGTGSPSFTFEVIAALIGE
jgi:hypothetical protein